MDEIARIYLDYSATTPLCKEARTAMEPFETVQFANAAAIYDMATEAKRAVEVARKEIAEALHAAASELYFTSGGTESDNWALIGFALANQTQGKHLITTQVEHHAVLHTMQFLERMGFSVTYLPVDTEGILAADVLERAMREDTILVSVIHANNEIGTIQDIEALARVVHAHKRPSKGTTSLAEAFVPAFHTDAVQSFGHVGPMDVHKLGVDLLSASGHKFGGPKGIGFLYIREGLQVEPLLHGGRQERGQRAGTLNVAGIVGMGEAVRVCSQENEKRIRNLRDLFWRRIRQRVGGIVVNGISPDSVLADRRLGGHLNLCISGVRGEHLVLFANARGVCISTGSACTTGDTQASHVLKAIGRSDDESYSSVRLTFGVETTQDEVERAVNILAEEITRLRLLSPYPQGTF